MPLSYFFICGAVWLVYVCYDIQSVLHGILCILMGQFERAAFSKKVHYGYKEMSEVSITICNYHTFNHKKQQHAHLLKMSRLIYIQTANWMKCHTVSLYDVACIDLSGVADWCCKLWLCYVQIWFKELNHCADGHGNASLLSHICKLQFLKMVVTENTSTEFLKADWTVMNTR